MQGIRLKLARPNMPELSVPNWHDQAELQPTSFNFFFFLFWGFNHMILWQARVHW